MRLESRLERSGQNLPCPVMVVALQSRKKLFLGDAKQFNGRAS